MVLPVIQKAPNHLISPRRLSYQAGVSVGMLAFDFPVPLDKLVCHRNSFWNGDVADSEPSLLKIELHLTDLFSSFT